MDDCIFCKIVKGSIPCSKVYEDENVIAFDDIHPMAPVHVVIIPKEHIATILDVSEERMAVMGAMVSAAREVASQKGIDKSGFRVVINCNKVRRTGYLPSPHACFRGEDASRWPWLRLSPALTKSKGWIS